MYQNTNVPFHPMLEDTLIVTFTNATILIPVSSRSSQTRGTKTCPGDVSQRAFVHMRSILRSAKNILLEIYVRAGTFLQGRWYQLWSRWD